MKRVYKNLCPATISASIMAVNMRKNGLKNVESDNNKILYEAYSIFFYSGTVLTLWISVVSVLHWKISVSSWLQLKLGSIAGQFRWYLWWSKWNLDKVFSQYFFFSTSFYFRYRFIDISYSITCCCYKHKQLESSGNLQMKQKKSFCKYVTLGRKFFYLSLQLTWSLLSQVVNR